jgi:hypothetical protein
MIEGNWIHDTLLGQQGSGIDVKQASYANVLRNNTVYNTSGPCILLAPANGQPPNRIEGNAMWNCAESGIQVTADAIIQNNIIFGGPGAGLRSFENQGVTPSNLEVKHNTLVGGSPCLSISNWSNGLGLVFANNAVYCESPLRIRGLDGAAVAGNVVYPAPLSFPVEGYTVGQAPALDFADVLVKNVYPSEKSSLIGAGDLLYGVEKDFNGSSRSPETLDAGAYSWSGRENPGPIIRPWFKQFQPRNGK